MRSHAKAPSAGSVWIAGAALILAFALLALSSASALAAAGHAVVRTFSTGVSNNARSIAVDSDGYSYVLEKAGRRVEKFDAAGNRVNFTGSASYIADGRIVGTPNGPFEDPSSPTYFDIDVDSSGGPNDGDIYVVQELETNVGIRSSVFVYDSTGIYRGKLDPKNASNRRFCSVSVNQANGDLYFAAGVIPGGVLRYAAPTGDLEAATPNGTLQVWSCAIAADNTGAIYASAINGPIARFDASQFGQASPTPSQEFTPESAQALALGQAGELFADRGSNVTRWNSAGVQQGADFGQLSGSPNLALGPAGNVFAIDSGGGVFVLEPNEVQLPTGTTGAAINLTPSAVKVEGNVDPDGAGSVTACEFRYGEDTGYSEGSAPCTPGGAISSPTGVSAGLTGLVSNTTYHYRLFLTNANGTQMETGDQTFTTPVATQNVQTGGASNVQRDSAELNGAFEGDGQNVHYFFEWGETNGYGNTTPSPPGGDAGTAAGPQSVAPIQISGLKADRTYHYRLVVSTASGFTRGQDETLTTADAVTNLTVEPPTGLTDTSLELHASFDGDSVYDTDYYYEWGTGTDYGNTTPPLPGGTVPAGAGRLEIPPVLISGLKRGFTYHYRLVASTAIGTTVSTDNTIKTAEAPVLGTVRSQAVLATSAELLGEVNPRHSDTAYRFEWGPSAAYGNQSPTVDAKLESGDTSVPVSTQLEGLTSGITYHFRLVATNQYGTTASRDQTFGFYPPNCPNAQLRQETRSNTLPDCRAYELVTPTFAQGALIFPAGGPAAPFATRPSKIAYSTGYGTFPESTGDPSNISGDEYVSTRTDTGWQQKFIGLPATEVYLMGGPPRWHIETPAFTHLNSATNFRGVQANPDMSRLTIYNRGWPSADRQAGHPSNVPYVWDTTTGRQVERWPTNLAEVNGGYDFVGVPETSEDFGHFIFQSNVPFAPGGTLVPRTISCCGVADEQIPPRPAASIYDNDLETGAVNLASIKGDNVSTFEGFVFDISEDGSRILMSEEETNSKNETFPPGVHEMKDVKGPLYLRANNARTYEIAPGHQITYLGSSGDGGMVYLTSAEQLTAADHDDSVDLYTWNENGEALTLISAGDFGDAGSSDNCTVTWSGGGCNIEPIDIWRTGTNSNGYSDSPIASRSGDIYFVSPEQLLAGKGSTGRANLYLYRHGTLRFVAAMDPEALSVLRMQVTPDGEHMAFVTKANITGYDSAGHAEMYTYEPEADSLTCASCRPNGAPPSSEVQGSMNGLFQTYDGRVFFSTSDALVPRDTNQSDDVYEYTEGRAQLITAGLEKQEAPFGPSGTGLGLVSVSANGLDAYVSTLDILVTQDHNGQEVKIYDARTGGGFPAEVTPAKCLAADECHGPGSSPPALPPDRSSASLGKGAKSKAHKAKKHKRRTHKKKRRKSGKQKSGKAGAKQGRSHRG